MDPATSAAVAALPPAWQHALLIACGVILAAKALCALTPTPPPNTAWGRVYAVIETLALLVGKSKMVANPIVTPQDVVTRLAAALNSEKPLSPEVSAFAADILGKPAPVPPTPPAAAGPVAALLLALFMGGALSGCSDAPKAVVSLDAAYVAFANAEVGYAKSGQADPAVASKLLAADAVIHDALKAMSQAEASGDNAALSVALKAAKAEVANIGPVVAAIGYAPLSAALSGIQGAVAAIQAPASPASAAPPSPAPALSATTQGI